MVATTLVKWHPFEGRLEILSAGRVAAHARATDGDELTVRVIDLFDTPDEADAEYERIAGSN